ncbi:hypothetical protein APT59_08055 [Pseudomonas oryzihabitans]|uniref:Uncharacterized protein n=1 Tax=Pseudomonas oryzihabitans TaxID=47885 RepID=A0A0U4XSB9_9PSED|nr:hypothetical protein APT59_08055 [Pseudomonas oryzihabitans]
MDKEVIVTFLQADSLSIITDSIAGTDGYHSTIQRIDLNSNANRLLMSCPAVTSKNLIMGNWYRSLEMNYKFRFI